MAVRTLLILVSVSLIIVGLFGCSEAPFDPNSREEIDIRGDLNLDGLGYTMADVVMFSNYFISGIVALKYNDESSNYSFPLGYDASIAASDVNADGRTLDLADLVYLIRIVVGDLLPHPPRQFPAVSVNLLTGNSTLAVDYPWMGAAYVVIVGDNVPVLLADNMEMKSAFDGVNTHVLIWSMNGVSFGGEFLGNVGEVVSVELATAEGGVAIHSVLPTNFGLGQNYPNPFNSTTNIEILLPVGSDYQLLIKNSTNKIVTSFSGHLEAGFRTIQWDATGNSAGVYYATLTIGDWEDSIKMLLL